MNNQTFAGLTELSRLNLASNRFTTTFRLEYFAKNLYLNDIWLGDNPWRCECWGFGLKEFYQYLTVPPQRVCICGVMHLMAHVIRFNRFFLFVDERPRTTTLRQSRRSTGQTLECGVSRGLVSHQTADGHR